MSIGNNIKQLRQQKNITQEEVAKKLGVSSQAVSKWENNANTPDIMLLPVIADLFNVPIDALFSDSIEIYSDIQSFLKNDDVFRVVQMRGSKIVKVSSTFSPDEPPIEIAFPHDCNDRTQYFKVEVYGHIISDGSINGDVVCHQSIQSGTINGDVKCEGNIKVNEINCQKVICNNITECYHLQAGTIECRGDIHSATLTCDHISDKKANSES
ncbi:MAG: helix-turn-helix domain-containing protein [Ruminococcus sp.]|nr:helix-turn-helix domain-containing protein [Candidatus Apopatosoma intestinale]